MSMSDLETIIHMEQITHLAGGSGALPRFIKSKTVPFVSSVSTLTVFKEFSGSKRAGVAVQPA